MVRIVSGAQQDPNAALLRGQQLGSAWRQARQARAQEERAQMDQAMQMQAMQMRIQKARTEREEALAKATQMGDVRAMQEAALRQRMDPTTSAKMDVLKMRQGLTHPDSIKEFDIAADAYLDQIESQQRMKSAQESIANALKDGLIDEATAQESKVRLDSGEEPEALTKHFADLRMKNAESAANVNENARAMEQIQAMVDAAPQGPDRKRAEILLEQYRQAPSLQEKAGSGADFAARIQRELVKSREAQIAQHVSRVKDRERLARDFAKMSPSDQRAYLQRVQGRESPNAMPPPLSEAQRRKMKGAKEQRYPGSTRGGSQARPAPKDVEAAVSALAEEAATPQDLRKALEAQGIQLTAETLAATRKALQARRTNAQAGAGADRK